MCEPGTSDQHRPESSVAPQGGPQDKRVQPKLQSPSQTGHTSLKRQDWTQITLELLDHQQPSPPEPSQTPTSRPSQGQSGPQFKQLVG